MSASGDQIAFRRSITLMLMTVALPGSAQLVAGNKRVGRVAVCVWAALCSLLVGGLLLALVRQGWVISLVTHTGLLLAAWVLLIALAMAWIALLSDAWRLGDPLRLARPHRLVMVGLNTGLCLVTGGALLFSAHLVAVQRSFITSVFSAGAVSDPHDGRYNVLLLGGDSGAGRWGLRPDSISVASIDEQTGRTLLFALPRNMQKIPFPEGSVMQQQFPDGFDCDDCYLNGVYTWALDNAELFDKSPEGAGIEATKQAVEGITGLQVNYYALVNLAGFTDLVDAVGGVQIDVPKPIPIGGIGSEVTGYIEPGPQRLDGFQTQWFARSRVEDDDYARMARQKCVLNAMLQQLSPRTVVLKVQAIADAGKQLLRTDIPASELDTFIGLALKAKSLPLASVSFVPPTIQTYDPDYELVHAMVDEALVSSREAATTAPADDGAQRQGARRAKRAGADRQERANGSDDLSRVC
ncbi:MAG: LCP family protein [Actinomycetota bacterium]|nr:LCP family protein [Actinomycetota bacterium]